jgi:hypothetical protein
MLVELLAYAAGRPQDVLALTWEMVGQQRLVYAFKNVDGKIVAGAKTGEDKARSVAMLPRRCAPTCSPTGWSRQPAADALGRRRPDGGAWRSTTTSNWSRVPPGRRASTGRAPAPGPFAEAAAPRACRHHAVHLRHTYASLRIAEQRLSLQEIADELGHDVDVLAKTYAHVISEYRGQGPIDPDRRSRMTEARRTLIPDGSHSSRCAASAASDGGDDVLQGDVVEPDVAGDDRLGDATGDSGDEDVHDGLERLGDLRAGVVERVGRERHEAAGEQRPELIGGQREGVLRRRAVGGDDERGA